MKRLLLILSPYLLFCLILSTLLVLRPRKIKDKNLTLSDTTQVDTSNSQQPLDVQEIELTDTSQESSILEEQPSQESVVQEESTSEKIETDDVENNSFVLVVGSFKKETTANQLCEKLKPAGFNSRVEKKDQLYRVIAGDYKNEKEAQNDFVTLKDIGFEPWISEN